ncbi:MAG: ATP-binding protein [Chloroflexaceae bacterium]
MMEPLTVPGTLDSLSLIGQYVTEAAQAAGLEKKAAYRLRLAVDEIATNVATYGYAEAGITGTIVVNATIDDETLTITLEDTAAPFDPLQHDTDNLGLDLPLDERRIGGLGVFLALNGVDQFYYQHVNDRNRNVFVMKRT